MEEKSKKKKILNIISGIITYIFLAICIFAVVTTIVSKRSGDGTTTVFGYQMRLVLTDSMAKNVLTDVSGYEIKSIPAKSLVFVKVMPDDPVEATAWYRSLKVGDVLTFKYVYTTQETITHRIVDIQEKSTGGFIITLEGDNKSSTSGQLKQVIDTSIPNNMNYVIGKVVGQSRVLGFILNITRQPAGLALIIIVPCVIIIIFEIGKIMKAIKQEKSAAVEQKPQEQEVKKPETPSVKPEKRLSDAEIQNEIDDLMKRLEELQKGTGD